jgi:hypothetical protein
MRTTYSIACLILFLSSCRQGAHDLPYAGLPAHMTDANDDTVITDSIIYHPVRLDNHGNILPWFSKNPGEAYDHVLSRVWAFWKNLEIDSNGMPYYMNHQVWDPGHDKRGLGGDQLMMALSSWDLYYNFTGDQSLIDNMRYIADYYLTHSLSPPDSEWPNLPFPYNTNVESGIYDGDMILGKGFLQPDKAGSFGDALVRLYKKTGDKKYLTAAADIANTLASKVSTGNDTHSHWPFKVNAATGQTGILVNNVSWYEGMDKDILTSDQPRQESSYTTFWTGTLNLFSTLRQLGVGDTTAYADAFEVALAWMKNYPAKTNKWGPFFEDIPRWSDTQINAMTYARFLIEHPSLDPQWQKTVTHIFEWVHRELDNDEYTAYGVVPINEQTAYRKPGNSHSARQAAVELMYWEQTGDTTYCTNNVRQLNWATYMVDHDGKNFYPTNAIWMTDGYGDYVRHYLRAMAAAPQLAPENQPHHLRSASIVRQITYEPGVVRYEIFDQASREVLRLPARPTAITVDDELLSPAMKVGEEGWTWQPLATGGILRISQQQGSHLAIHYQQ